MEPQGSGSHSYLSHFLVMTSIFGDRGRTLVSSNQSTQTVFLVLYARFLHVPTSATPNVKLLFYLWKKFANFKNIIVMDSSSRIDIWIHLHPGKQFCRQDMGLGPGSKQNHFKQNRSNLFLYSLVASWILISPRPWLFKVAFLFLKPVPSKLGNCKGLFLLKVSTKI